MLTTDKINCTVDFERDGKQFGNLELSFSDNHNAFARVPVPVVNIKNGPGPTLAELAPHASKAGCRRYLLGQHLIILWWQHLNSVQLLGERSRAQKFYDCIGQLMSRWSATSE